MSDMLFDTPRPEGQPKNPVPEVFDKPYKHSIVDSEKTPIEALTAWLGGSNWQVDYYSQIFGKSEELKSFDPTSLKPYQNYHKINRLILKLQGAIDNADQPQDGRYELTGTAVIPPHPNLIPNVGDAFIADMGEGQAGQFTVVSIQKLANNLASAWRINFKHERGVDRNLENLMNAKVTKESYYNRDYLITGQNGILATEEYMAVQTLEEHLVRISNLFITNNFSWENHTLILPGQDASTYDPFVVRAALKVISSESVKFLKDVRELNCDDHRIPKFNDIYTAILKRDKTLLYGAFRDFGRIPTNLLTPSVFHNSIRYTGIKAVIVPYKQDLDNDGYVKLLNLIDGANGTWSGTGLNVNGVIDDCHCWGNIAIPVPCVCEETPPELGEDPMIGNPGMDIPTITNASYVVSDAFYDKRLTDCSLFERMLWDILDNKPLDNEKIYKFVECYHLWGKLEQFYLGPLLILLIRACLRGVH